MVHHTMHWWTLLPIASALVADYGSSDEAVLAALSGRIPPRGVLPVEIPRSMDAVRASATDVPDGTADPVFPRGFGLRPVAPAPVAAASEPVAARQ